MADFTTIELAYGKKAVVDTEDLHIVLSYRWHLFHSGSLCYAGAWERQITGARKLLLMHRLIMQAPKGIQIDHRNGDSLDNRRLNLRFSTPAGNMHNRRRLGRNNISGWKGVSFDKQTGKWRAQIALTTKGKIHSFHLGRFDTPEIAAMAYDAAAVRLFGEFAAPNSLIKGIICGQRM